MRRRSRSRERHSARESKDQRERDRHSRSSNRDYERSSSRQHKKKSRRRSRSRSRSRTPSRPKSSRRKHRTPDTSDDSEPTLESTTLFGELVRTHGESVVKSSLRKKSSKHSKKKKRKRDSSSSSSSRSSDELRHTSSSRGGQPGGSSVVVGAGDMPSGSAHLINNNIVGSNHTASLINIPMPCPPLHHQAGGFAGSYYGQGMMGPVRPLPPPPTSYQTALNFSIPPPPIPPMPPQAQSYDAPPSAAVPPPQPPQEVGGQMMTTQLVSEDAFGGATFPLEPPSAPPPAFHQYLAQTTVVVQQGQTVQHQQPPIGLPSSHHTTSHQLVSHPAHLPPTPPSVHLPPAVVNVNPAQHTPHPPVQPGGSRVMQLPMPPVIPELQPARQRVIQPVVCNKSKPYRLDDHEWGSSFVDKYVFEEQVGEGTYGQVYKARDSQSQERVALKKVRLENEKEGFPITAVREIKILRNLDHKNIVKLMDIVTDKASYESLRSEKVNFYLVFEYVDHDLMGLLESRDLVTFTDQQVAVLFRQLVDGIKYAHEQNFLHRDIKCSNILVNNRGELKIADFGLARRFYADQKRPYTNRVITLWYRPPELLLGEEHYGPAIDVWSVGCILGEFFVRKPLFMGSNELMQLELISKVCGTPSPDNWPTVLELSLFKTLRPKISYSRRLKDDFSVIMPALAVDLLDKMLILDPARRITAADALNHPWFKSFDPRMVPPLKLPQNQDCHEMWSKRQKKERERARSSASAAGSFGNMPGGSGSNANANQGSWTNQHAPPATRLAHNQPPLPTHPSQLQPPSHHSSTLPVVPPPPGGGMQRQLSSASSWRQ